MDQSPRHNSEAVAAALLAVLRTLTDGFVKAFGAPMALIEGGAIYGEPRKCILRWLNDMEMVARRLLLLRASLFPPLPAYEPPLEKGSGAGNHKEAAPRAPSEDSSQWRVSFRIDPPRDSAWTYGHSIRRRTSSARRVAYGLQYADDPRPLAERFEALLRIVNDSDLYAARLAQRLHRWRCRPHKRLDFLRGLCATADFFNEAGLDEAAQANIGAARLVMLDMMPVFGDPMPALTGPETG